MTTQKDYTSSGERLRRARILSGVSTRREFEEKHAISANTLQGWEQGKNPLSEKGARRVIEAFKKEGLLCSLEWLIHGHGMPPRPYEMVNAGLRQELHNDANLMDFNLREEQAIYNEIQLFRQQNMNSIVLSISDDSMEPYYSIGDYIGGCQISDSSITDYLHTVCIIELENNLILPRYIQSGKQQGVFTASCTNPRTAATPLNLYNVKIISAAPIIWHRRKISSLK